MNKFILGIGFLTLLLLSLFLVSAQNSAEELDQSFEDALADLEEQKEVAESFKDKDKWDYLSEKWKEQLLKNEAISRFDSSLQKLSPAFNFLLGVPYSLSLIFLFAFVFWVFMFTSFYQIFRLYSLFSNVSSFLASFITVFLLANMRMFPSNSNIYSWLAELTFKIIFYREGFWSWISFFLLVIGYFIALFLVVGFFKRLRKDKAEMDKKREQNLFKANAEVVGIWAKTLTGRMNKHIRKNWGSLLVMPIIGLLWVFVYLLTDWVSTGIFWWFMFVIVFFELVLMFRNNVFTDSQSTTTFHKFGSTTESTMVRRKILLQVIIIPLIIIWVSVYLLTNFIPDLLFWIILAMLVLFDLVALGG